MVPPLFASTVYVTVALLGLMVVWETDRTDNSEVDGTAKASWIEVASVIETKIIARAGVMKVEREGIERRDELLAVRLSLLPRCNPITRRRVRKYPYPSVPVATTPFIYTSGRVHTKRLY